MKKYQRIAVASAFSPTFASVLEDAKRFADHCGATLDVIHAGERTEEKETRFREVLGPTTHIHWVSGETPAKAIATKSGDFDLLIAGALKRDDSDKPFTSGVARDLLRNMTGDLLLAPAANVDPKPFQHAVFAIEPGEDDGTFIVEASAVLGFKKATLAAIETPFAAAMASSRGEEPRDVRDWTDKVIEKARANGLEAESWIVTSNTGYPLYEAIQGMAADLLVVKTETKSHLHSLPMHMDWLYQVIPLRLLVVKS
jgi:nucleotide-binding universal stress UspA family protein